MRLEHIPLIVGLLLGAIGIGLLADAFLPERPFFSPERRRRQRAERNRVGEGLIGFAALCVAASFIGRDEWRYSTLAMLIGAVAFAVGVILNRQYLGEALTNRGPARRSPEEVDVTASPVDERPPRTGQSVEERDRREVPRRGNGRSPVSSTTPPEGRLRIR